MLSDKMFDTFRNMNFRSKLKISPETIFKIFSLVVSGFGLIYQVLIIYHQFMSGKTFVNIEIGRLYNQTLSAITICYDALYSVERAAQCGPGFAEFNRTYVEHLKSKKVQSMYRHFYEGHNSRQLNQTGIDMNLLFDKLSIKFKNLDGDQGLKFTLFGDTHNDTVPGDFEVIFSKIDHIYGFVGDPLETIVVHNESFLQILKCFTFFSSAQKQWRNFHAQLELLRFTINWETLEKSFPIQTYNFYYISIHSPNHLPDFDEEKEWVVCNGSDARSYSRCCDRVPATNYLDISIV